MQRKLILIGLAIVLGFTVVGLLLGAVTHQAQAMPASQNWQKVNAYGHGDLNDIDLESLQVRTEINPLFLPCVSKMCPPLFRDDFSNPASGWPKGDTGNTLFEYINSEYRILIRPKNWYSIARPGFQSTNYRVSVDLRNIDAVMSSYGIAFGITQDWSGKYTLEIYPDGWFGIYRYDPDGSIEILAEDSSSAIQQGTATNHISVERNGASIIASANDQLLASVSDSTYIGSLYLGLINYTFGYENADIRYDNFRVDSLTCNAVQSLGDLTNGGSASWSELPQDFNGIDNSNSKHQP